MNLLLETYKPIMMVFILFGMGLFSPALRAEQPHDSISREKFFELVDSQLERYAQDTSYHSLFLLVRGYCNNDPGCYYHTYRDIMGILEGRYYDLRGAILIGKEALRELDTTDSTEHRAAFHYDLYRYYHALNLDSVGIHHFEESTRLFELTGNRDRMLWNEFKLLEARLEDNDYSVVEQMNALLDRASAEGLHEVVPKMHLRLAYLSQNTGDYKALERHTAALAAFTSEGPPTKLDDAYRMQVETGLGMLALQEGKTEKALEHLHRAVRIAEESSSIWLQIRRLQFIASVEFQRDSLAAAERYLMQTDSMASALELHDLLAYNYAGRAQVAEADGRPADALRYTKLQQQYQDTFDSRQNGFSFRRHQLEKENREREAELARKETKLRRNRILIGISLLLAVVFLIAFLRQRHRAKQQELSAPPNNGTEILVTTTAEADSIPPSAASTPELSVADRRWLQNFDHYLDRELSNDLLSIGMLSEEFAMSDSSLLRQVKRLTGMTPQRYLLHKRMSYAQHLLRQGRYASISEVAGRVGYSDSKSFSRTFKRIHGVPPSEYTNS